MIGTILEKRTQMRWIILSIVSLLTGYFTVQYLVQQFSNLALYSGLLSLTTLALFFIFISEFKMKEKIPAIVLILVCIVIGFSFSNYQFLSKTHDYDLPVIERTDGGDGHTAIIYFTHGEPPGYDPFPWRATIQELDNDNVPFVPWILRPMFFNTLRKQYLTSGGSPHNKLHYTFIDNLRRAMPEEIESGTRFYLGFLDSPPHPDQITVEAINNGASTIIILPVFVTESTHTIAGVEMIESVEPEKYNIDVKYTGALGDSDLLQKVFVERAIELSNGFDKTEIGILLVGHGQPTEWENLYPEQNRQESEYRDGIRAKLIADGFLEDKIIKCWMSFQEPTIQESAKKLDNLNIKKLLVFSVSLSAEAIHSQNDVPEDIMEAELSDRIEVEYVGQYGDHPLAIQAMVEKINSVQ
jgi:protoheme ferro-lyase